ncbi:MAG TPA: hypothetical protein VLU43_05420 [Anaeromyxobacteraceae bacterium]|nr:hypothetical protein [Anaeromyxobacteraceae bacterium]
MPVEIAFAPYRLAPGALPEEAARAAEASAAEPLVAGLGEPLPTALVSRALADVAAGRAGAADEACRAADGSPAGGAGPPRACLSSERHRARIAEAVRSALATGFAGVCLDRPDAPLALGLLGAGFCPECQRDLARHLSREYGEHFQPVDYLALAREALAQAPGAVGFDQLPFGRDFWRVRNDALGRAVQAYARAARDAAREVVRPFEVVAQFEALGPAQLRAARHLDAAVFPAAPGPGAAWVGLGIARLLRAALGRRPCAVATPADPPGGLVQLAGVVATCGVDLAGAEAGGEAGARLAAVRRLAREVAGRGRAPAVLEPVAECAILYSAESDLWTGGRHRSAVTAAGEALAALHVQAPVVLRVEDAPDGAALVLADAEALSGHEARLVERRLTGGGNVLAFGTPGSVDDVGRAQPPFLPAAKPGGVKVGTGHLAGLAPLAPGSGAAEPVDPVLLGKAVAALLGKGRRAAGAAGRARVAVVLHRGAETLDAHLVALGGERAQGTTLFLGVQVAGGVRRARFQAADGTDLPIPLNPSGFSISTVLPAFAGYAVLSLPG